jgi:BirA family biotin operon repressor/biotin-[acetyl-CoA-carboxylase] ligase
LETNILRQKLVKYLSESDGSWISGEFLSRELNISRTAVSKHIKVLNREGYAVSSRTKNGYKLMSSPDYVSAEKVQSLLETSVFGKNMIILKETMSTNMEAALLAENKCEEGTVVISENQTGGRGRSRKKW